MSKKGLRILSIVALVFVAVFTVTFILFLFDSKMGGGAVAFTALFSGIIGIALFFIVKAIQKRITDLEKLEKEMSDAENGGEPDEEVDGETASEVGNETDAETETAPASENSDDVTDVG